MTPPYHGRLRNRTVLVSRRAGDRSKHHHRARGRGRNRGLGRSAGGIAALGCRQARRAGVEGHLLSSGYPRGKGDSRPGKTGSVTSADSPPYLQHFGVGLTAKNRCALYVPEMFAHGFQTLEDDTEIFYQISEFYAPNKSAGVRFDDPKLGILWPLPVAAIADKDRTWPLLQNCT